MGRGQPPRDKDHDKAFNTKKADCTKFIQELLQRKTGLDETTIDSFAETLVKAIQNAATASMATSKIKRQTWGKQPWWNLTLRDLKKDLDRRRRTGLHVQDRQTYNSIRNNYLKELRSAKMAAWRQSSGDINTNTWGKVFKWAKKGSARAKVPTPCNVQTVK